MPIGTTLTALYGGLARLRRDLPALRSPQMYPAEWAPWQTRFDPVGVGVDVDRQLVIYHRWATQPGGVDNVVVVLELLRRPAARGRSLPGAGPLDRPTRRLRRRTRLVRRRHRSHRSSAGRITLRPHLPPLQPLKTGATLAGQRDQEKDERKGGQVRTRITNPNSLTVHAIAGCYVVLLGLDLPKATDPRAVGVRDPALGPDRERALLVAGDEGVRRDLRRHPGRQLGQPAGTSSAVVPVG